MKYLVLVWLLVCLLCLSFSVLLLFGVVEEFVMLKFEGFVQIENRDTLETDEKDFSVIAKCEVSAKKKVRARYKKRKHIRVYNVILEYVSFA